MCSGRGVGEGGWRRWPTQTPLLPPPPHVSLAPLTGEITDVELGGLFFAIGHEPATKFLDGQVSRVWAGGWRVKAAA